MNGKAHREVARSSAPERTMIEHRWRAVFVKKTAVLTAVVLSPTISFNPLVEPAIPSVWWLLFLNLYFTLLQHTQE
jgi:hypothetical protein